MCVYSLNVLNIKSFLITYQGENWAKIMLSFFKRIDYGFYLGEEIDVHRYQQSNSAKKKIILY